MEKDKDGYYEFTLMHSGVSAISGIEYPEPVLAAAMEGLVKRTERSGALFGEVGTPRLADIEARLKDEGVNPAIRPIVAKELFIERINSVRLDNVAHVIDPTSLRMENGKLVGKVKLAAPNGEKMREVLEDGLVAFAMRSFVTYEDPNAFPRQVATCQIITFDMCDAQPQKKEQK